MTPANNHIKFDCLEKKIRFEAHNNRPVTLKDDRLPSQGLLACRPLVAVCSKRLGHTPAHCLCRTGTTSLKYSFSRACSHLIKNRVNHRRRLSHQSGPL